MRKGHRNSGEPFALRHARTGASEKAQQLVAHAFFDSIGHSRRSIAPLVMSGLPRTAEKETQAGFGRSGPQAVIALHGKSDQYSSRFVSSASAQLHANQEEKLMIKVLAIACLILQVVAGSAIAQQAGIKRTVLHSFDFPEGYTTVTAVVELPAGTCAGRHTHPGIDSGYVVEGDFVLKVDGRPEQKLKAGDSFETQPMTIHDACSVSGTKLVDTWVIERGKPLATLAN